MDDATQMRVGKHMNGIIGLKPSLAEAAARCMGMTDDQIGEVLLDMLGRCNYIETGFRAFYAHKRLSSIGKHCLSLIRRFTHEQHPK
jgi:hypothetical protein